MDSKPRKNAAAAALGRKGKNRRKTMTPAAIEQRRMATVSRLAKRLAREETHFQLPPGPLGADSEAARDADFNDAE